MSARTSQAIPKNTAFAVLRICIGGKHEFLIKTIENICAARGWCIIIIIKASSYCNMGVLLKNCIFSIFILKTLRFSSFWDMKSGTLLTVVTKEL